MKLPSLAIAAAAACFFARPASTSPSCSQDLETILGQQINARSTTGFIASGPLNNDWREVSIDGQGPYRVFYRRDQAGERQSVIRLAQSGETTEWRFRDGCLMQGRVTQASLPDDRELTELLRSNGAGLIYLWSPSLPFSVQGLDVIREIAAHEGLPLKILKESAASSELRTLGAFNHFPALLVYRAGHLTSSAHIGFRGRDEWTRIIHDELSQEPVYTSGSASEALQDAEKKLAALWELRLNTGTRFREIRSYPIAEEFGNSAFFQVVPDHPFVVDYSYRNRYQVHLIDLRSGATTPSRWVGGDPYPFPDGRVVLLPERTHPGPRLQFTTLEELSKPGGGTPFFTDERERDWYYGSAGYLDSPLPGVHTLRVLTKLAEMTINDYRVDFNGTSPVMKRLGDRKSVCRSVPGGGPVLSRDASLFTILDARAGLSIYQLPADPSDECPLVQSLGFLSAKTAWDTDSSDQIAISTQNANYVYRISTRELKLLPSERAGCTHLSRARIVGHNQVLLVCEKPRMHVLYGY